MRHKFIMVLIVKNIVKIGVHLRKLSNIKTVVPLFRPTATPQLRYMINVATRKTCCGRENRAMPL